MIKMIKGVYCHKVGDEYVDVAPEDPPVQLSEEKEAELVRKGCAEYVEPEREDGEPPRKGKKKAAAEDAGEP